MARQRALSRVTIGKEFGTFLFDDVLYTTSDIDNKINGVDSKLSSYVKLSSQTEQSISSDIKFNNNIFLGDNAKLSIDTDSLSNIVIRDKNLDEYIQYTYVQQLEKQVEYLSSLVELLGKRLYGDSWSEIISSLSS